MNNDWLDEDGYPTEEALLKIEQWDTNDQKGWFEFIQSIWHLASWGWHEVDEKHEWRDEQVHRYHISTAGWSGNESVIAAMKANIWMWGNTWVQSRRGGHYTFELDED